jgi:hypothetical protein
MVESKHKNSIQYYSLETSEKVHEIRLAKEGPFKINEIHGFSVISQDSILVFDKWRPQVMLIDSKGNIIRRIELTSNRILNHASMTRLPNVIIDGKLCMFVFPTIAKDDPRLFEGNIFFELVIDLKRGESTFLNFTWPECYKGKKWTYYHTFPSRVKNTNDKLVYSFGADPNLYEVALDGSVEMHLAKSDYIEDIRPYKPTENEGKVFLETGVYGMIIYDRYRKLYYRVAGLETVPFFTDGRLKQTSCKKYSLILLDSNFNKVGETLLLPVENYLIKDWFVCKKGLCISTANPLNRTINENEMRFNLLVLDTLKTGPTESKVLLAK